MSHDGVRGGGETWGECSPLKWAHCSCFGEEDENTEVNYICEFSNKNTMLTKVTINYCLSHHNYCSFPFYMAF